MMPLAPGFEYVLEKLESPKFNVILRHIESKKTKHFFFANSNELGLHAHMLSLTEEQCESFVGLGFKKPQKPAKKVDKE